MGRTEGEVRTDGLTPDTGNQNKGLAAPKAAETSEDLLMLKIKWLGLQLFGGEGGAGSAGTGDGGGDGGAATGVESSAAAGQSYEDKLRARGVPEDKIRRRAKNGTQAAQAPAQAPAQQVAAAAETTEVSTEEPTQQQRVSFEELMKDPEYNAEMQKVVQNRLKTARADQENLQKLAPALELLAKKYNLDAGNMDYEALTKAISDDDEYYEDKALQMGVSVQTAKMMDQQAKENERLRQEQQRTVEQQKAQQHLQKLFQQGEAMKATFPKFDLRAELQNPVFARMTSPNVGLSVEDAYYAVHRKEIQTAAMQATAQQVSKKLSNSIQSGKGRPAENGTSGQAPSVTSFDYAKASKEQREAFKKDLQQKWARGEKVYPGQR